MRKVLSILVAFAFCLVAGCNGHGNVVLTSPMGNVNGEVVVSDTKGRVLWRGNEGVDRVRGYLRSKNISFVDRTGFRGVGGCEDERALSFSRAALPDGGIVEVKPSLRERFRNIAMFRSPNYVREINNGGDTPVTRLMRNCDLLSADLPPETIPPAPPTVGVGAGGGEAPPASGEMRATHEDTLRRMIVETQSAQKADHEIILKLRGDMDTILAWVNAQQKPK